MHTPTVVLLAASGASSAAPAWVTYLGLGLAAASAVGVLGNFLATRYQHHKEERRKYANQVAAWTGPHVNCTANAEGWPHHYHSVVVHNGSDQPVYNTVVIVEVEDGDKSGAVNVAVGLVPPGERVSEDIGHIGQGEPLFAIPLEVAFTDAHGVHWARDSEGRLRLPKREPDEITEEEAED